MTQSKIFSVLQITLVTLAFASLSQATPAGRIQPVRKGWIPLLGKPSAPIEFTYEVTGDGAPGSQVSVKVGVLFLAQGENLEITLIPGDGVEAGSGEFKTSYAAESAQSKIYQTVSVIPRTPSLSYLHINVKGRFGGVQLARSGSIPVSAASGSILLRSGSAKVAAPSAVVPGVGGSQGTLMKDSQGNGIISMPAQEKK